MSKEVIKKTSNTEQNISSDNDPSNGKSDNDYKLDITSSDNSHFLYWVISNFFAGLLMTIMVMIIIVRNQSKAVLINPKTEIEIPLGFSLQTNFFPSVEEKKAWLKQIKFSIDKSISNPNDYALTENYIKQQKKILASLPLSPIQKMVLSKTTIYWVASSWINLPNKAISYGFVLEPRKIGIALHYGLTKAELRSTLLNEIHHISVYEINQYKVKDKTKTKNILEYPFLNERGDMDNSLRAELSIAIDELNRNVKEFISLKANKYRNPMAEKKFSRYLDAINDYQPKVYRVSSHVSDREIDVVELEGEKGTLYRNKRPIVYQEEGKIQLLCSANKDNSRSELAQAFIYDYVCSYMNLKKSYKSRNKNAEAGEYALHSKFLVEASSAIDEMLTPRMREVFAKRFDSYFDNYAHSYMSYSAQENISNFVKGRLLA